MQPPILTAEFTRQIERHFAPDVAAPASEQMEVRRFGNTVARKVRAGWPASGVFCFNRDDVGRLAEILDFFGEIEPVFIWRTADTSPQWANRCMRRAFD